MSPLRSEYSFLSGRFFIDFIGKRALADKIRLVNNLSNLLWAVKCFVNIEYDILVIKGYNEYE